MKEDNDMPCNYSSKLNPIKLVFNVMVQRFALKYNESRTKKEGAFIIE